MCAFRQVLEVGTILQEELSQMPPQHGPPTGHESPRAGTGLKGQEHAPASPPFLQIRYFSVMLFSRGPWGTSQVRSGPRRVAGPARTTLAGRRAAGGGAQACQAPPAVPAFLCGTDIRDSPSELGEGRSS